MIHYSEEKGLNRDIWGMYCFFLFVKFFSTTCVVQAKVFVLQLGNGLMQVLWYWRSFMKEAKDGQEGSSPSGLEAS
ncbi:hypothetical protein L6164_015552 [Bauhinia variegata]|uniref:Uncharacterized protein n=1 Tax=Bauhinia variegata TaxID=167791 RepID=A0ACB9NM00_BAUVA|nr:hypothetical protein L6164_015552 [Bauhinia variegata]